MGKARIKKSRKRKDSNALNEQLNLWNDNRPKVPVESIGVLNLRCIKVREIEENTEDVHVHNLDVNGNIESSLSVSDVESQDQSQSSAVNNIIEPEIQKYPYVKRDSLLTSAEKVFYRFLLTKLHRINPDLVLLSKVRVADILKMADGFSSRSGAFYKIAYKHIDFVILDLNLDIICAVELDDFTHTWKKRTERDKFINNIMEYCGVTLFRVKRRVSELSDIDVYPIEMHVLEHIAPRCPVCGRPMEVKTSKYSRNYGHRFYGCMGYYESGLSRCNFTIDIDT